MGALNLPCFFEGRASLSIHTYNINCQTFTIGLSRQPTPFEADSICHYIQVNSQIFINRFQQVTNSRVVCLNYLIFNIVFIAKFCYILSWMIFTSVMSQNVLFQRILLSKCSKKECLKHILGASVKQCYFRDSGNCISLCSDFFQCNCRAPYLVQIFRSCLWGLLFKTGCRPQNASFHVFSCNIHWVSRDKKTGKF